MIKKIAVFLPFEQRLGQVLPYVARIFEVSDLETDLAHSKVKVAALEVILSLFEDLIGQTDEMLVEPFDFKVF